jgi:predicted DCC family thiol-disulfide oxidoreductase YuxK
MPNLILYDGVCGLCNRLIQFTLKRDLGDRFRFASLQSPVAADLLRHYGRDSADLDTVYVVANYGSSHEILLAKAHAVLFVLRTLGGVWYLARPFALLPTRLLDSVYDFVASRRYRWFGRSESCMVPSESVRAKFIDKIFELERE